MHFPLAPVNQHDKGPPSAGTLTAKSLLLKFSGDYLAERRLGPAIVQTVQAIHCSNKSVQPLRQRWGIDRRGCTESRRYQPGRRKDHALGQASFRSRKRPWQLDYNPAHRAISCDTSTTLSIFDSQQIHKVRPHDMEAVDQGRPSKASAFRLFRPSRQRLHANILERNVIPLGLQPQISLHHFQIAFAAELVVNRQAAMLAFAPDIGSVPLARHLSRTCPSFPLPG